MSTQYKTPFHVRTSKPEHSFADQETGLCVHGKNIALVESPIGMETMKRLKAGGLVIVGPKSVAKAKAEGRVIEGDCYTRKTKIVLTKPPKGSLADEHDMMVPKEVPLTEEDEAAQAAADAADAAHASVDDEEVEPEGAAEAVEDDEEGEGEGEDAEEQEEGAEDTEEEAEEDDEPGLDDALKSADKPTPKKTVGAKTTKPKTK